MSLFKKILGRDAQGVLDKADRLFAEGHFGNAKLEYERARDLGTEATERSRLSERINACMDGIAKARLEHAKVYLEQRSIDLAREELEGAIEVAADEALKSEMQALIDSLEKEDALEQVIDQTVTDEERLALIIGQWEEPQADEYDQYGDELLDALVLMHKEVHEEARQSLEQILGSAKKPRYLWLEVGRARILTDNLEGAREALANFLDALEPDEGGEARLAAHFELARMADEAGDFDGAMGQFEAAVSALDGDYRPYLAMGAFLRAKKHAAEAIDVLKAGLEVATTEAPNWRTLQELGLASIDTEQPAEATQYFEQVIEFFNGHQFFDYPVESAVPLAELYEKADRLDRAADIYRALAKGSDQENVALYHYEAGRILQKLELVEESHRMLTRAEALCGPDEELAAKIRNALAATAP